MRESHDQGNTMQDHLNFQNLMVKYGEGISLFDHIASSSWRGEVELTGFSARAPQQYSGEWLVVVRGVDGEGGPVVAFHSAVGCAEAVAGAARRIKAGNMKWKVDEYRR